MAILMTSENEKMLKDFADMIKKVTEELVVREENLRVIGPADAGISRINDIYRKVIYYKHRDYKVLVKVKDFIEKKTEKLEELKKISLQFDFNPVSGI